MTFLVAPFVGAWIEIAVTTAITNMGTSLRSSERGLKFAAEATADDFFSRSVRRSVD